MSIDVEIGVIVDDVAVGDPAGEACEGVLLHATNIVQHIIMRISKAVTLDHLVGILNSLIEV